MDTSTTKKTILTSLVLVAASLCFIVTEKHLGAQDEPMPYAPGAFGVWGWDWLTTGGDAQRSSSVRNDRWISRAAVASPGPRLIYKISLPNTSRQMNALSQPLLVQTARGLTGFKSMGYVAGSGGTAFGFDFDTSQVIWKTPLGAAPEGAGTLACPGGLTTSLGRPTPLTIPNVTDTEAGRGVAPGNLPSARKSGSAIGKPGQGAPIVDALANAAANGGGGAGRGGGFGGSGGRGGGRGGASGVFALAADGMLHQLSMQQGFDIVMRPAPFLPPNANASGLIVVDNVAYAATSNDCAGVPNGIWALDLASPARAVTSWKTGGANIAGTAGPAFDANGTLYVATGEGPGDYANSIVTLAPKT
ncbi:MAG TPA: hypothetical protein VG672_03690, partial [Bryobacteraceae bacterium]|nr:hypothetical protein [Bryobacteraceae bacterium]